MLLERMQQLAGITERVVTFGKQAFPDEGQVVVMVGGPGVGKGFVLNNLVPIHGKVLNIDAISELVAKVEGLDLKDPKVTNALHKRFQGLLTSQQTSFINTITKDNKPNIIFDTTGRSIIAKTLPIIRYLETLGYESTLVYVYVDDLDIAWERNVKRKRTVPRDVFDSIHAIIPGNVKATEGEFDHVWYIQNHSTEPQWWIKHPEWVTKVK